MDCKTIICSFTSQTISLPLAHICGELKAHINVKLLHTVSGNEVGNETFKQ